MLVKVTNIEYDIIPEDFECEVDESDFASNSDYIQALLDKVDEEINSLPSEMSFEIDDLELDIEDTIANLISDKTGWLVRSFKYKEATNEKKISIT